MATMLDRMVIDVLSSGEEGNAVSLRDEEALVPIGLGLQWDLS